MTPTTELVRQIQQASDSYYNGSSPILTDRQFDALQDQLRAIDPTHPVLARVGAAAHGEKCAHARPMMSLNKVTTDKDLLKWLNHAPYCPVLIEPKADGATAELVYLGGVLQIAISRGDGLEGEDITTGARKMQNVPARIAAQGHFSVRGEVLLSYANWGKVDPLKAKNPRSTGNGVISRKDGDQCELLWFRAFEVEHLDGPAFETEASRVAWLNVNGFATLPVWTCEKAALTSVNAVIAELAKMRSSLPFQIDGAVLKFDSMAVQAQLGVSSERPNGQVAFKWESDTAESVVLSRTLTVGHTGAITPVANIQPVDLMGTEVSCVMLNNWNWIAEKGGVAVGDTVEISKGGDIIPVLEAVLIRPDGRQPIAEPTECPVCGGPCGRRGGALTYCLSDATCPSRVIGKLKRWINSRNILEIGDEVLEQLIDTGMVECPADLYQLHHQEADRLSSLKFGKGRLGQSRTNKILANIEKSKACELHEFIGSLGISFVGVRKAADIIKLAGGKLDSLEQWLDRDNFLSCADQCHIPGVAAQIADDIEALEQAILDLESVVVLTNAERVQAVGGAEEAVAEVPAPKVGPAYVFCITGTLSQPKSHFHDLIVKAGHSFEEDFRSTLSYLVVDDLDSTSGKAKKARKAGIPLITEQGLLELL